MFAIYIPGRHRNDATILREVGAGWALDPSVTAMFLDVEIGPDGGAGKLVYFESRRRMTPYKVASFQPATQRWLPAAKDGDQTEGRYWVGLPIDHRPAPDDLQRETVIDGLPVKLCDDQHWVIPIVDYFPQRLTLNRATGQQEKLPFAGHIPFVQRTNDLFRHLISDQFHDQVEKELRVQIPDGLIYAADALAVNYRANRDLVDMLELIGEFEAVKVAAVATGLELLGGVDDQKKTRLLAMPSCDA